MGASDVLVSQRFVLSADKTTFVPPQVLEGHDLTAGLSGINFLYLLCDVLLHRVFDCDVLAVRRSVMA